VRTPVVRTRHCPRNGKRTLGEFQSHCVEWRGKTFAGCRAFASPETGLASSSGNLRGGRIGKFKTMTKIDAPADGPGNAADGDHSQKMQRRKAIQDRRMAETITDCGLVIVHTGAGKGKTTAALGMVLRSLGHGYRVAIVQFIKGAWEPAEKRAFEPWGDQLKFHATGDGFTWETQDKAQDKLKAQAGWKIAQAYLEDPEFHLVLLDEINIALKKEYLSVEQVLSGIGRRPPKTHVILTGRNAPNELIERADLVTEMSLVKHPLKLQRIRAQAGIEF
jgi:cob(I)alamin adenosyltransferase